MTISDVKLIVTSWLRRRKLGSCHGDGDGDRSPGISSGDTDRSPGIGYVLVYPVYHEADGEDDRDLSRTGDRERGGKPNSDRPDLDRARSRTVRVPSAASVLVSLVIECQNEMPREKAIVLVATVRSFAVPHLVAKLAAEPEEVV